MQPKLRAGLTWITVISFSIFWWGGEEKKQIPFLVCFFNSLVMFSDKIEVPH